MRVCMYACMHVCEVCVCLSLYVCIYVCVLVVVPIYSSVSAYIHTYIHTHIHTYICTRQDSCALFRDPKTYIRTHTYTHTYIHKCRPVKTPERYLAIRKHLLTLWEQHKPNEYLKKTRYKLVCIYVCMHACM